MWKYTNGNTVVSISDNGTKVREYSGIPVILRPETVDVKITDYCDGGCSFCHEKSTVNGKHCSVDDFKSIFSGNLYGMELAIGGGNPMSHPDLQEILDYCSEKDIIANITVNSKHLAEYGDKLRFFSSFKYLYGIGISYRDNHLNEIDTVMNEIPNTVLHFIAGIDDIDTIKLFRGRNILILGYKDYGFGQNYKMMNNFIDNNILKLKQCIHEIIEMGHVSFDTLAIEQLDVRRFFSDEKWKEMFMGEEGEFSMYVDCVKKEYAISSFSKKRFKCSDSIVSSWSNLQLYKNSKVISHGRRKNKNV